MSQGSFAFPEQAHTHLRLVDVARPGQRRPGQGFPAKAKYGNREAHGREVKQQATAVKNEFLTRPPTLGLNPDLVMVLETSRPIDIDDLRRVGLTILELRSDKALIAFAADAELELFLAALDEYQEGSQGVTASGNERPAKYEAVFDSLDKVREMSSDEMISKRVFAFRETEEVGAIVRLEVRCWCGEDRQAAQKRQDDVRAAVSAAGGHEVASTLRIESDASILIVDLPVGYIDHLALLGRVRFIDVTSRPDLQYFEFRDASESSLPRVASPGESAPIVGIVDSGLRTSHPLISPAVIGADFVGGIPDAGDRTGHGTLIASLVLYGSLEGRLDEEILTPAGRICSVRVLNDDNEFQDDRTWVEQLLEALAVVIAMGARIVNLSLGDAREPYVPPRPTALAAEIDNFARQNNAVVVLSAGNYPPNFYNVESLLSNSYPTELLEEGESGLLDPASASLALTVGSLCALIEQGVDFRPSADKLPVGAEEFPSPFTRVGPGILNATKPELVAPGGSVSVDTLVNRVAESDLGVKVVGAGAGDGQRLLASGAGTSFAAPLVTHAALRVWARYPGLGPNAVRALVLASASGLPEFITGGKPSSNSRSQRRLTGYGAVSASRAESSSDHRAVMLAEGQVLLNSVDLYEVILPSSFFESGGAFAISVSLAFDPPVRATRRDYLANQLGFFVYFGASTSKVSAAYVRAAETEDSDVLVGEGAGDTSDVEASEEAASGLPASPAELRPFFLPLQPSGQERSRGANQFGVYKRQTRFDGNKGDRIVIAVRSINKWDVDGAEQSYAMAVCFERDLGHAALYDEMRAELPALVEVEVEADVEQ